MSTHSRWFSSSKRKTHLNPQWQPPLSLLSPAQANPSTRALYFSPSYILRNPTSSIIPHRFLPLYQTLSIRIQMESIISQLKNNLLNSYFFLQLLHTSSSSWAKFLEIIFFISTIVILPSHLHSTHIHLVLASTTMDISLMGHQQTHVSLSSINISKSAGHSLLSATPLPLAFHDRNTNLFG